MHKWHKDILKTPKAMETLFDDYPEQTGSIRSLTIINVSGAFCLLGIGLSCSAVIFVVELVKIRHTVKTRIFSCDFIGHMMPEWMARPN